MKKSWLLGKKSSDKHIYCLLPFHYRLKLNAREYYCSDLRVENFNLWFLKWVLDYMFQFTLRIAGQKFVSCDEPFH